MRDIRSDLEERGSIIQEQIKGAQVQFERVMLKLQSERDAKIAELTETLAMIDKLMQFEMGVVDKVVTLTNPQMSHSSLADRIKRATYLEEGDAAAIGLSDPDTATAFKLPRRKHEGGFPTFGRGAIPRR